MEEHGPWDPRHTHEGDVGIGARLLWRGGIVHFDLGDQWARALREGLGIVVAVVVGD